MRCLLLLLSLFALATSYYMPRAVYNFSPYRYENLEAPSRFVDGPVAAAVPVRKNKKASASDFLAVKRFKPCYYSPIQCLIKKRK